MTKKELRELENHKARKTAVRNFLNGKIDCHGLWIALKDAGLDAWEAMIETNKQTMRFCAAKGI